MKAETKSTGTLSMAQKDETPKSEKKKKMAEKRLWKTQTVWKISRYTEIIEKRREAHQSRRGYERYF